MTDGADRLLAKLRGFIESCDSDEREYLAMLLAPGIAEVYGDTDDDVRGFAMGTDWQPQGLADALTAALEQRRAQG